MDHQAFTTADTLELQHLNQAAIRAALDGLSLWVSHRGSVHIHKNVMYELATVDIHAEAASQECNACGMSDTQLVAASSAPLTESIRDQCRSWIGRTFPERPVIQSPGI